MSTRDDGSAGGPPSLDPPQVDALSAVLLAAQAADVLGPGPVAPHLEHALGFAAGLEAPNRVIDLGSGAGVPGLVLACCWPESEVVLLDANLRRCRLLWEAVEALGMGSVEHPGRVRVVHARAEELGRDPDVRGTAGVVSARSFAPPGVTAECAAPLLALDGILVTSEPPTPSDRWARPEAESGLTRLGLAAIGPVAVGGAHYHRCRQIGPCPPTYPRRPGIPAKRPLF